VATQVGPTRLGLPHTWPAKCEPSWPAPHFQWRLKILACLVKVWAASPGASPPTFF